MFRNYLIALAYVALASLAAKLLTALVALSDPALIFLTAVLGAAIRCGLGPSLFAAVASLLAYDFFFIEPLYALRVAQPQDIVSLIVFVTVAVVTSSLAARLRSQAGILAEKAKTEAVIEAIEDGLIVLDPSGRVLHCNEVACAIMEIQRKEILGRGFDDLGSRHPHYLRVRAALHHYLSAHEGETDRVEITLFLRGRDHYFVLRPSRFQTADGSAGGLILALQDVTYVRDQEAHREALVATLSHELRTPVTSLGMAQELLMRSVDQLSAEQRQLLETVGEDVVRLRDVAERFLNLSRSRAMSIALERADVDLNEIVRRVVRIFAPQASEKGVIVHVELPERRTTITADATKLTWAVSNLLSNALRYTPAGGRIDVQTTDSDRLSQVSVSDSGPGIAPEKQKWIFERFAQNPDSGDIGSAGLGLAIVRDIVEAHGGRIHLESALGHGSRFVLEIPR